MFFLPLLAMFPSLIMGSPLPPPLFQLGPISNPFIAVPTAVSVLIFKKISPGIGQGPQTPPTYKEKERSPEITFSKSMDINAIVSVHLKRKSQVSWKVISTEGVGFDNLIMVKESLRDQKRMVSRLGKRSSLESEFAGRQVKKPETAAEEFKLLKDFLLGHFTKRNTQKFESETFGFAARHWERQAPSLMNIGKVFEVERVVSICRRLQAQNTSIHIDITAKKNLV